MTRDQIVTTVLTRLGNRQSSATLVTLAKTELALIQDNLEGDPFMPWFLLKVDQTIATVALQDYTTLPTDFLREADDIDLWYADPTDPTDKIFLGKEDVDLLKSRYRDASPSNPAMYSLTTRFDWFPQPDAVYSIHIWYYGRDAALSDSVATNLWTANATDLLIAELGIVMAGYVKDPQEKQNFELARAKAYQRLRAFDEARSQMNRRAYRGD